MNMQTIAGNIWLQFTLLAIAVVVLIVLAAQYIW
jgi:membrane protein implicated in regulation of membrane protease activity